MWWRGRARAPLLPRSARTISAEARDEHSNTRAADNRLAANMQDDYLASPLSSDLNFILVKELGPGNIVEVCFASELDAREAAGALWCSWVLFHHQGSQPSELCQGGFGFAHETIRRYVIEQHSQSAAAAPVAVASGLELVERCSGSTPSDVILEATLEKKPVRGIGQLERGVGAHRRDDEQVPKRQYQHRRPEEVLVGPAAA